MGKYFLIESRSPFDATEVNNNYQLAADLANAGHEVTLFLVENGVLAVREVQASSGLLNLHQVKLLADEFSLRERGISTSEIAYGVHTAGIDTVVEAMATGQKTIWL